MPTHEVHDGDNLQTKLNQAQNGDNVVVHPGTYAGPIVIHRRDLKVTAPQGPDQTKIVCPIDKPEKGVCVQLGIDAHGCQLVGLNIAGGYHYAFQATSNWDSGEEFKPYHGPKEVVLRSCRLHDSGDDVIKFSSGCHGGKILDCEIFGSGRRSNANAQAIDVVCSHDFQIARNVIRDCFQGIYVKGGSRRPMIEGNRIEGILLHHAVGLGQATDWQWFDHDDNPEHYECIDGMARFNIIKTVAGAGIFVQSGIRCTVHHNTLLDILRDTNLSSWGAITISGGVYWKEPGSVETSRPSRNVEVRNNIVTTFHERALLMIRDYGGGLHSNSQPTLGGNLWWAGTNEPRFIDQRLGTTAVLPEAGSKVGEPKLDAAFRPNAGSPAIGSAQVGYSGPDYYGKPVSNPPDAGAVQTASVAPPPVPPPPVPPPPVPPPPVPPPVVKGPFTKVALKRKVNGESMSRSGEIVSVEITYKDGTKEVVR